MSRYDNEKIVRIEKFHVVKSELNNKVMTSFLVLVVGSLSFLLFTRNYFEDDMLFVVALIIAITCCTVATIMVTRPTLIRLGEIQYHKTVLTTKYEYDDYKKVSKKKGFKKK